MNSIVSKKREKLENMSVIATRKFSARRAATFAAAYRPGDSIARFSRLCVICCTRSSGPCGRVQCDQGSVWPGGSLRPWAQKIVEALKTKLPFGPG